MKIETYKVRVQTEGYGDIHDLTPEGQANVKSGGVKNGQATFFVIGSTAGLTTVEYEPGLVQDLKDFFERLAPQDQYYHHEETWHDGNGFSHVRASLLKPSLTVPIVDHELVLGTWQQVVLIDFDNRPRKREVLLQVMGI
ncbi:MAG: secondary thiamine-phosphate synthase enzyme YjbQ [Candidatus Omnitrophota bacterium]|nr:secondary thiamine-phosphate synthase enzyme YjbQ [Candidatus Omnitrophota bacterium]